MNDQDFVAQARAVAEKAYCPYSRFRVGAAILTRTGHVYVGCNVENASYGVTICAERGAIMAGRAAEGDAFAVARVALYLPGVKSEDLAQSGWPCGACRQALAEFASDEVMILSEGAEARYIVHSTMGELLPRAFRGALVSSF